VRESFDCRQNHSHNVSVSVTPGYCSFSSINSSMNSSTDSQGKRKRKMKKGDLLSGFVAPKLKAPALKNLKKK